MEYSVLLDDNECETDNGMCGHLCTNVVSSYVCSCFHGYTLNTDGTKCSGKTFALLIQILLQHIKQWLLHLFPFQPFSVVPLYYPRNMFNMGFYFWALLNYNFLFVDIDECLTGESDCQQNCFNSDGSYACGCKHGFVLDVNGWSCNGMYDSFLYK